MTDFIKE